MIANQNLALREGFERTYGSGPRRYYLGMIATLRVIADRSGHPHLYRRDLLTRHALVSVLDQQALAGRQFQDHVATFRHETVFSFSLPMKQLPAVIVEYNNTAGDYPLE
jgi:hypothetical protein